MNSPKRASSLKKFAPKIPASKFVLKSKKIRKNTKLNFKDVSMILQELATNKRPINPSKKGRFYWDENDPVQNLKENAKNLNDSPVKSCRSLTKRRR